MRRIIGNKLLWIDTINIEDTAEMVFPMTLIDQDSEIPRRPRTVTIKCKAQSCIFLPVFALKANDYKKYLTIIVENVTFENTTVILFNMNVHFEKVTFVDTITSDKPLYGKIPMEVELVVILSEVNFINRWSFINRWAKALQLGMVFDICSNMKIEIRKSYIQNYNIFVNTFNVMFEMSNTSIHLQDSSVNLETESLCVAFFKSVTMHSQTK